MAIYTRLKQSLSRRPALSHFIVFLLVYIATAMSYQYFIGKASLLITLSLAVACSILSGFIAYGRESMLEPLKRCAGAIATKPSIRAVIAYAAIIIAALGVMGSPETPQGIEVLRITDIFVMALSLWLPINFVLSRKGLLASSVDVARWVAIVSVFRALLSVYIDTIISNEWEMRAELTLTLIVIAAFSLSHSVISRLGSFFREPINPLGIVSAQSKSPPSDADIRRIAAHEAAHAMVYAGLKSLPDDLEIHCLDGASDCSLGYVTGYASPHKLPDRNYVRWQMLVYLAGKEGELLVMGQPSLGCSTDYERWESLAKTYLSTDDEIAYFAKPANKIELSNNTLQLNLLKKNDISLLVDFLGMNAEVYLRLVEEISEKKVLKRAAIKSHLDQVIFPENFPQQVI